MWLCDNVTADNKKWYLSYMKAAYLRKLTWTPTPFLPILITRNLFNIMMQLVKIGATFWQRRCYSCCHFVGIRGMPLVTWKGEQMPLIQRSPTHLKSFPTEQLIATLGPSAMISSMTFHCCILIQTNTEEMCSGGILWSFCGFLYNGRCSFRLRVRVGSGVGMKDRLSYTITLKLMLQSTWHHPKSSKEHL